MVIWIRRREDERKGEREYTPMATQRDAKVLGGQSRLETAGKVGEKVRDTYRLTSRSMPDRSAGLTYTSESMDWICLQNPRRTKVDLVRSIQTKPFQVLLVLESIITRYASMEGEKLAIIYVYLQGHARDLPSHRSVRDEANRF
jgi:hypothetical protein